MMGVEYSISGGFSARIIVNSSMEIKLFIKIDKVVRPKSSEYVFLFSLNHENSLVLKNKLIIPQKL